MDRMAIIRTSTPRATFALFGWHQIALSSSRIHRISARLTGQRHHTTFTGHHLYQHDGRKYLVDLFKVKDIFVFQM